MSDISANERRLIAALDRLDHAVERGGQRLARLAAAAAARAAEPAPAQPAAAQAAAAPSLADQPASAELAALHDRQNATLEAMRTRLAEAHERLAAAGEQAARLAAANEALAAANRQLIEAAEDWAGQGADATQAALQAELEALRAARAAEIAQMGEIMDALDRMLGVDTTARRGSLPRALHPQRGADAADVRDDAGSAEAVPSQAEQADVAPLTKAHSATVRPGRAIQRTQPASAREQDAAAPAQPAPVQPAPEQPARELTIERDAPSGSLFGGVYDDVTTDLASGEEDR